MASFPNIYTHRKVADTASKSCDICYKPSTSVLVCPGNKDFFYICPSHLKDKGFCHPIVDEAAVAAKKKEMDDEVARVKAEFEEKQKQKQKKKKEKEKEEEKDKSKEKEKEKDKTEKIDEKAVEKKKIVEAIPIAAEEEPRVFALQKAFYQQRIDKKRNAEIAKRNRERLQNPNLFPRVPEGFP